MRREKERRFVVAFDTTAAAFQTEKTAQAAALPGRLIPTPQQISAGCGFAWSAPADAAAQLLELLEKEKIIYAAVQEMLL